MRTFIFACIHNAGRSQMSAALFNRYADPAKARAISAGTQPAEHVHPVVMDAMSEIGIDLSSAKPQKLTADLAQGADTLITMGCGDECPYVPGFGAMTGLCPIRRGKASKPSARQGKRSRKGSWNCWPERHCYQLNLCKPVG